MSERFPALAISGPETRFWDFELLGSPVFDLLTHTVYEAGGVLCRDGSLPAQGRAMLLLAPAPALSPATLTKLYQAEGLCVLRAGRQMLAVCGESATLSNLHMDALPEDASYFEAAPGEGVAVCSAETAYAAQESLRRRVNMSLLAAGVFLTDPNTAHISPLARLESGVTVLPNCQIYGRTTVTAGCIVGPNALLRDAELCEGVTVNASQVIQSRVGAHTTVGPFAYIRPGCNVGEHVRIGDFVELKNSTLGDGTKVSHLTYIGDSDFGKDINVGCGVVTVNYDGKRKHRTKVEDNAFIGCNVNLVPPVTVGESAYLAAGGTVTEDVPAGSLLMARSRPYIKEGWVAERKEQGKL
ncbi:MAG: hypothetical protein VB086_05780 [Clostridiaceae bacterium]|nr:hypothetical protein [Clostridiaceae bacterium]